VDYRVSAVDLGIVGRVALVMGASKGLGRASAAALAREGARVALSSRSAERIEQAAAEITAETGGEAVALAADTDAVDELPVLVERVGSSLGPVEILVTNTGGPPLGDPLSFSPEDWERAYRSLVLAPMTLIEAVVPGMRERGWGRIVNVTSIATKEPIPGLLLSNSHRLAAVGAFKTLSRELARDGILLNSVAPGRIATDRIASMAGVSLEELRKAEQPDIPVGRLGTPEEFGDVVAFLCSERASYVNGVNLMVDGGLTRGI
jgi:3-oxoacyl-[acyl-carrier protein] reductase